MWCKLFGHNWKEYRNIECVEVLNIIRETTTVKCNSCGRVLSISNKVVNL